MIEILKNIFIITLLITGITFLIYILINVLIVMPIKRMKNNKINKQLIEELKKSLENDKKNKEN